jgi:flavin-dependent thymidylate synthase
VNVQLIDYTGKGVSTFDADRYAAELLVFTKSTRLNMDPALREKIARMSDEEIQAELDYIANTIPSSWEFIHFTFLISGVSRGFAQQFTRTRTGSYAMQSQRVADVSMANVVNPYQDRAESSKRAQFSDAAERAMIQYQELLADGHEPQDARGVLPINVECNLVAGFNLRSLSDMIRARKSLRTQGEYRNVIAAMERCVLNVYPWATPFFEPKEKRAIEILESVVEELGMDVGSGPGWQIAKAIDLIRK